MLIPDDKIEIPEEKITDYLLVQKLKNDKSGFLFKLGYSIEQPKELAKDIRYLATHNEAQIQQRTQFGDMYEVKGMLRNMGVVTIWLLRINTDKFRFITLFPQ